MAVERDLSVILERLPDGPAEFYPTGAFAQVMWDNVGYLIDDHRRLQLFREFQDRIGLDPTAILEARHDDLLDIATRGGMHPDRRVGRWRDIAEITLARAGGDLDGALRALPLANARALLKLYPTIADPGADKILLFAGVAPRPSLDSNGVRAMVRMGFAIEQKDYPRTWKLAVEALDRQLGPDFDALRRAYRGLRAHGQTLCKRNTALCAACPLDETCAHAVVSF